MKRRASLAETDLGFLTVTEEPQLIPHNGPALRHPSEEMASIRSGSLVQLPLEMIDPNPDQPRKKVQEAHLDDLARSIKENGILQPVLVLANGSGRFELLAGERRYRAARLSGLEKIPAIVREKADRLEIALVENLQREDLHPVDAALACAELARRRSFTHEALAAVLGKKRSTVTEILSLATLPRSVLDRVRSTELPQRTLVEIAKLTSEAEMHRTLDLIRDSRITGEEVRARRRAGGKGREHHLTRLVATTRRIARLLTTVEPEWNQLAEFQTLKSELLALRAVIDAVLAGRSTKEESERRKQRKQKRTR